MENALEYHEPSIVTILLQSSFLVSSNAVRYLLDRLLACGIVGQIFIGILFGEPSNFRLLTPDFQRAVVSLGYLGLILLCFQGGTHSSLADLWANKHLSFAIALTGILLPITLSFLLIPIINASLATGSADVTALQAFAAGAALSATSLGTSLSIISVAGLQHEKVGIILSSAAMMDDVVGLILIAITKSLGLHQESIGSAVARPIAASFGSVVVLSVLLWTLQQNLPAFRWLTTHHHLKSISGLWRRHGPESGLVLQLLTLFTLVSAGTYAGTSPLFMAFLAGVLIAWSSQHESSTKGLVLHQTIHQRYLQQIQDYLLLPFFFASIGFAIPIRDMFSARVVWQGLLYTVLMASAKFMTGAWLLLSKESFASKASPDNANPVLEITRTKAALLVGFAMMARGEVAFLIASIAQSAGIFANSEIYMVIIWAAMLCTVIGPIGTGIVVKTLAVHRDAVRPVNEYQYEVLPTEDM
ncbi:hypothetical protein C0993_011561 [Termitomyces sp. T159_Od127]|nr:hypothetical protein C0993_011561 [Termitomyces sp. T159_Od127]